MKKLLIVFLCLPCMTGFAQNDKTFVEAQISIFISELENKGIENYFYTQRYCEGENQMFLMPDGTRCFTNGDYLATYVVWMEEGESMIRKIDNCGMYVPLKMEDNTAYSFFEENIAAIEQRPVKTYDIRQKEGGPVPSTDIYGCHRGYTFSHNGNKFSQAYRLFDLTNVALEENLNYVYNSGLEVVDLDKYMDTEVTRLEESKSLRRSQE